MSQMIVGTIIPYMLTITDLLTDIAIVIETKLQTCINNVSEWTNENGFIFSTEKTRANHFTVLPELHPHPNVKIYGDEISYDDYFKFLRLAYDSKLTWRPHILTLKTKCQQMTRFLRSISTTEWGADPKNCYTDINCT